MLPIIICYTSNDGSIIYNNQELGSSKPKTLNYYATVSQKLSSQLPVPKYQSTVKDLVQLSLFGGITLALHSYSFALCKLSPYSQRAGETAEAILDAFYPSVCNLELVNDINTHLNYLKLTKATFQKISLCLDQSFPQKAFYFYFSRQENKTRFFSSKINQMPCTTYSNLMLRRNGNYPTSLFFK